MDNLCGGVILWITHDDDAASTGFDYIVLGDALCRVVGAFGMKIRMDFANDGAHVFFWEYYDGVHIRQRRQNFRAFIGGHYGPPFALQRADGSIAVDRDNQLAAELPGGMQVAHMADVQQIEAAVGQRDTVAGVPPIRYTLLKFAARNNLLME